MYVESPSRRRAARSKGRLLQVVEKARCSASLMCAQWEQQPASPRDAERRFCEQTNLRWGNKTPESRLGRSLTGTATQTEGLNSMPLPRKHGSMDAHINIIYLHVLEHMQVCVFILSSGHFYSAPSSPLPIRGAPDYSTDTVSEFPAA